MSLLRKKSGILVVLIAKRQSLSARRKGIFLSAIVTRRALMSSLSNGMAWDDILSFKKYLM